MARAHLRHHYFCFIGTGSCGAGTGISSRVLSNSRCQELSATIDADVQCLQQGWMTLLTPSPPSLKWPFRIVEALTCFSFNKGGESWHHNWFSTSPWLTALLPSLLGPLVGPLLLISFGPWAFSHLTSLIKQQVDDWAVKPIHMHYHRLALEDLGKEGSASTPISTQSDLGNMALGTA